MNAYIFSSLTAIVIEVNTIKLLYVFSTLHLWLPLLSPSLTFSLSSKTGGSTQAPLVPITVQFSHSVVSDSLWPHGLQFARLPCPSPAPGAYSNSCPLSWWCHPTISSSVVPFSLCLQSFPASRTFPRSQFFISGGQSTGVSYLVLISSYFSPPFPIPFPLHIESHKLGNMHSHKHILIIHYIHP